MSWLWYALIASALWGLEYSANQYLLKTFNTTEIIFVESLFVVLALLPWVIYQGELGRIVTKLSNLKLFLIMLFCCLVYMVAIIFIFKSIVASNATLAALVESSYPIFTMIFAYLLLGQIQFNVYTIIGSVLIISGLILINGYGQVGH